MPRVSVREEIVDAAVQEFHRRGFNGCSVEDITKAAGVPKGSFYNHFKSKEDLAVETIRRYAASLVWSSEVADGASPLQQLRSGFEIKRDALVESGFTRGCLYGNMGTEVSDSNPAIRAEVDASLTRWSGKITALLRQAAVAGEIPADLAFDQLGRFIVNTWEGSVTRSKVVKNAEPTDDFFALVFGRLLI